MVEVVKVVRVVIEVQSNFKSRIRYIYGYLAQITVPSVFTGCDLTNKNLSTAMEIKTQSIYFQFSLLLSQQSRINGSVIVF